MLESLVQYSKSKPVEVGVALIGRRRYIVHPMNLWTSQNGHIPEPSLSLHGQVVNAFQGGYIGRFHACKIAFAINWFNHQLA